MKKYLIFLALLFVSLPAFGQRFVKEVDTISAMRALNPADVHKSVFVKGYYAIGDGGGGLFFPTNSTLSTNFGTRIIGSFTNTFSWQRVFDGPIDLRWFGVTNISSGLPAANYSDATNFAATYSYKLLGTGTFSDTQTFGSNIVIKGPSPWIDITAPPYNAVGDDLTDNASALTAAIAASSKGTTIFVPSGKFKFSSLTIPDTKDGIIIRGTGWSTDANDPRDSANWTGAVDGSVLVYTGSATAINLSGSSGNLSNFQLRDIAILGPGGAATIGINNTATNYITRNSYDNILIANFNTGIRFANIIDAKHFRIHVLGCNTGMIFENEIDELKFFYTEIQNCTNGIAILNGSDIHFYSGILQHCGIGLNVRPTNSVTMLSLSDFWFEQNTTRDIRLDAAAGSMTNVRITGTRHSNAQNGEIDFFGSNSINNLFLANNNFASGLTVPSYVGFFSDIANGWGSGAVTNSANNAYYDGSNPNDSEAYFKDKPLKVIRANVGEFGLILTNRTAATSGNQKNSPLFRLTGNGFATTSGTSRPVDWVLENLPVQGSTNPGTDLLFQYQQNGGGLNIVARVSDTRIAGNSGLWLRDLGSPSGSNYTLLSDGANSYLNGSSTANIRVGNSDKLTATSSAITVTPTTDSTSTTTGSLVSSGGAGIAKNLSVGTGIGSYATSTAMTIAATGATNSTSINQVAYLTAATGLTLKNNAGSTIFSGVTISALTPIVVQPGGSFTGTAITSAGSHAQ